MATATSSRHFRRLMQLVVTLTLGCSETREDRPTTYIATTPDASNVENIDAGQVDSDFAYIINTKDPSLTVVSRATRDIVRTIEFPDRVGIESGHFGSLTADGRRLW